MNVNDHVGMVVGFEVFLLRLEIMPDGVVEFAPMTELRSKILRVGRFEVTDFCQIIPVGSDGIIAILEVIFSGTGA